MKFSFYNFILNRSTSDDENFSIDKNIESKKCENFDENINKKLILIKF